MDDFVKDCLSCKEQSVIKTIQGHTYHKGKSSLAPTYIRIGKTTIPKGKYSLYTVPKPGEWLLVFN